MAKKTRTDLYLDCPCGARSPVFQGKDSKWFGHYINYGGLTFWSNPMLTEKLKYGGRLCPHNPEIGDCKNGKTSFCELCRIRVFVPGYINYHPPKIPCCDCFLSCCG